MSAEYEHDDFFGDLPPSEVKTVGPPDTDAGTGDSSAVAADSGPANAAATAAIEPPAETAPARRGRGGRRGVAATPETTTDTSTADSEAASPQPTAVEPAPLSVEVQRALASEHLPTVPRETEAEAWTRLTHHLRGGRGRFYNDYRTANAESARIAAELREFKQIVEPVMRSWYEQQQLAQREQAMAAIPDREADPQAHQLWLLQQIARQNLEREQREAEQIELARREADQHAQQDAALGEAEALQDELERTIASDEEAATAYRLSTRAMKQAFTRRYPEATPDQINQLTIGAQTVYLRDAKQAGISIGDLLKWGHRDSLELYRELLTSQGQGQGQPGQLVNGNATPAATAAPNGKKPATVAASPTAQRISRQQSQQAARAVVSPTPNASGPTGGLGFNPSEMDEDAWLEEFMSDANRARELMNEFNERHTTSHWRG